MNKVPRNRNTQAERWRAGLQEVIIIGGRPTPSGLLSEPSSIVPAEVWNEVNSHPELMRTLPRSRFRDTFGDQVRLPERTAKCLEDFEAGLRAAGLMGVDEIISQSFSTKEKFRVKKRNVAVDGRFVHDNISLPVGNALTHSAVETGRQRAPTRKGLCKMRAKPAL